MARKSASKVSAATAAAVAAANGAVLAPTFQAAPVAASTHLEAIAKVGGVVTAPVATGPYGTLSATIPAPVATRVAVATGGQGAILAGQVLALLREAGTPLTVPYLAERMGVAPVKVRNGIDALRRTHGKGFVLNTGLATFGLQG